MATTPGPGPAPSRGGGRDRTTTFLLGVIAVLLAVIAGGILFQNSLPSGSWRTVH